MSKTLPVLVATAALAVTGCMTKRVAPTPSSAILETRARAAQARAHPASMCATVALAADAPVEAPFAYERDDLTEPGRAVLDQVAAWLICKPAAYATISGEADPTGTAESRAALAAARAAAARTYLTAHGVAAGRLLAGPPVSGQALAVVAKGRGW